MDSRVPQRGDLVRSRSFGRWMVIGNKIVIGAPVRLKTDCYWVESAAHDLFVVEDVKGLLPIGKGLGLTVRIFDDAPDPPDSTEKERELRILFILRRFDYPPDIQYVGRITRCKKT